MVRGEIGWQFQGAVRKGTWHRDRFSRRSSPPESAEFLKVADPTIPNATTEKRWAAPPTPESEGAMKTVKDLRAALKGLPADMPVIIDGDDEFEIGFNDCCFVNGEPTVALEIELYAPESERP